MSPLQANLNAVHGIAQLPEQTASLCLEVPPAEEHRHWRRGAGARPVRLLQRLLQRPATPLSVPVSADQRDHSERCVLLLCLSLSQVLGYVHIYLLFFLSFLVFPQKRNSDLLDALPAIHLVLPRRQVAAKDPAALLGSLLEIRKAKQRSTASLCRCQVSFVKSWPMDNSTKQLVQRSIQEVPPGAKPYKGNSLPKGHCPHLARSAVKHAKGTKARKPSISKHMHHPLYSFVTNTAPHTHRQWRGQKQAKEQLGPAFSVGLLKFEAARPQICPLRQGSWRSSKKNATNIHHVSPENTHSSQSRLEIGWACAGGGTPAVAASREELLRSAADALRQHCRMASPRGPGHDHLTPIRRRPFLGPPLLGAVLDTIFLHALGQSPMPICRTLRRLIQ